EIFFLVVIGLIVIGPERLPRVIEDIRAAIFAARNAIENAKKDLSNEIGPEFDELSKPISELATLGRMGPKAAITKALLDGDSTILDAFDPKKIISRDELGFDAPPSAGPRKPAPSPQRSPATTEEQPSVSDGRAQGGFSWADVT
ncbi:MAG: hypothetical protein Q4A92_09200, partial [Corynebacterium sp.]|nr:hypothetical protein [Corynebacterium sp.]